MIIQTFPNKDYRFEFYINYDKLKPEQIKARTGCKALINLGYYDMAAYSKAKTKEEVLASTACDFILNGKAIKPLQYFEFGCCITDNGELKLGTPIGQKNYCIGLPPQYINGKKYVVNKFVSKNGCTHIGFLPNGDPVWLLAERVEDASGKIIGGLTNDEANQALLDYGCVDILRYDGSWSSQGDFGDGQVCAPAQTRIVQSYLLAFERTPQKKEPVVNKKIVCLDPGHGVDTVNGSPDGTYKEHEFTLDMANRIRPMLERHGVEVVQTRVGGVNLSLEARVNQANSVSADLFVSLHSNAAGNDGWYDASGLCVFANFPVGKLAANLLLTRMREAGVNIFGAGLFTSEMYVLQHTDMAAYLVEYGFHTSQVDVPLLKSSTYRDKLATATAKAILDHLKIVWQEAPEAPEDSEEPKITKKQANALIKAWLLDRLEELD